MRTKKSIRNIIVALCMNFVIVFVGFLAQKLFLVFLGTEYLGINGLFTNIISMLSVVELGFGAAIIYNLYKPINENNTKLIKSLMAFYKKSYRIISLAILVIGLIFLPFLNRFIGEINISENIYLIFLLFLFEAVSSYYLSYKRSYLYATQNNYIINLVHIIYVILLNAFQILILYFTKNYYIYLILKIIFRIIENVVLTYITNRKYQFLQDKEVSELSREITNDITKKAKALFFHKIGSLIVLGSDNIMISIFFGVKVVGLYSNYSLIITTVSNFVMQIFSGITASIGNMLVLGDYEKNYDVYKKIRLMGFFLSAFSAICFCVISNQFIPIWIGAEYLLKPLVIIALSINLFFSLFRYTFGSFKEAAGIFYEDRYVPLFEAAINLIASILLLKFFGLAGVFLGTIISNLFLHIYSYPKYVYKKVFDKKEIYYYKEFLKYVICFVLALFISINIVKFLIINNSLLKIFLSLIISALACLLIIYIFFGKSEEFNYYIQIIKKRIFKIGR